MPADLLLVDRRLLGEHAVLQLPEQVRAAGDLFNGVRRATRAMSRLRLRDGPA